MGFFYAYRGNHTKVRTLSPFEFVRYVDVAMPPLTRSVASAENHKYVDVGNTGKVKLACGQWEDLEVGVDYVVKDASTTPGWCPFPGYDATKPWRDQWIMKYISAFCEGGEGQPKEAGTLQAKLFKTPNLGRTEESNGGQQSV